MDGVKEREDIVNKIVAIKKEGKLDSLDPETKKVVENALLRMEFELRAEAATIKRNIGFLEDYREARQARRP